MSREPLGPSRRGGHAPSAASFSRGGRRLLVEAGTPTDRGRIVKGSLHTRGDVEFLEGHLRDKVCVDKWVTVQEGASPAEGRRHVGGEDAPPRGTSPSAGREPAEALRGGLFGEEERYDTARFDEEDASAEDEALSAQGPSPQRQFQVLHKVTVEGVVPTSASVRMQRRLAQMRGKRFFSTDEGFYWQKLQRRKPQKSTGDALKFVATFTQEGELLVNPRSMEEDPSVRIRRLAALRLLRNAPSDLVPGSISGRLLLPYVHADVRELLHVSGFCNGEAWRVLEEIRRLLVLRKGRLSLPSDRNAMASRHCLAFLASLKKNLEAAARNLVRQGRLRRANARLQSEGRKRSPPLDRDEAWERREGLVRETRRTLSLAAAYSTKGKKQPAVYIQLAALKPSIVVDFLTPAEVAMILTEVFQNLWTKFVEYSLRRRVRVSTAALVLDFSGLTEFELASSASHFLLSSLRDVVRAFAPLLIKKIIFYNSAKAGEFLWEALRPGVEHACFFSFCSSEEDLESEIESERTMVYHTTGLANDMSLIAHRCPLYALYGPPLPPPDSLFPLRAPGVLPACAPTSVLQKSPLSRPKAGAFRQLFALLGAARVRLAPTAEDAESGGSNHPRSASCWTFVQGQATHLFPDATGESEEREVAGPGPGGEEDAETETLQHGDAEIQKTCREEEAKFWRGMNCFHDLVVEAARAKRTAERERKADVAEGVDQATPAEAKPDEADEEAEELDLDSADIVDPDGHLGPSEESLECAAAAVAQDAAQVDLGKSHAERTFERIFTAQGDLEETLEGIGSPFENAWERSVQEAFDASVKAIREEHLPLSAAYVELPRASRPARAFPTPLDRVFRHPLYLHLGAEADGNWERELFFSADRAK
ncbi:UNVERIFIED_CONTAM: hypothetical protein HHA_297180 [Hammondia hammondi]|eukprot:XP_008886133.1 hypothetical protein HHA_297180 [Hammondia hammondi]